MATSLNTLLQIKNLSISYQQVNPLVTAVDDLSLSLNKGDTLGIIGESGCGKSSLALGIMGLTKTARVDGQIIFKGQNLIGLKEKDFRSIRWKEIALVFQNSLEVLNPVLTIKEQITEPLNTHFKFSPAAVEQKVIKLLNMVGLDSSWRYAYPHQLSGGMRQRVLLAMALSCQPELLIIDEPTTALDSISRNEILDLLDRLRNKLGFTMIVISHDIDVIRKLCSRIITMYCGRVIESGITSDVLRNPMHCYTRGLLNASPALFTYKDLWGIKGEPTSSPTASHSCTFYPRCCQGDESCTHSRPELRAVGLEHMVACHKGGIETFLAAEGIHKSYRLRNFTVKAVEGVDLLIRSGEVVALLGQSGSGKSTLAHILSGVMQPDQGKVLFRTKEVQGHWPSSVIGGIQIIFQDPFSSTSHRMKVLEVVKEPLDIIKAGNKQQKFDWVKSALEMVQLPVSNDFLNRHCYALSGGQRQRLAIARALVTKPRLLIADEITSMLDPSTQANLLRELKDLQNNMGFAMLYITHDLGLARKIADKIYIMHQGKIVETGASFEIFDKPQHIYTQKLLQAAHGQHTV